MKKPFSSIAPLLILAFTLAAILGGAKEVAGANSSYDSEAAVDYAGCMHATGPSILVIQHEEARFWWMDYALNQLGIPHTTIRISESTAVELSSYDIVLVGSLIGLLNEVKPYLDAKTSEIEAWIASGGSLAVFCQYVGAVGYDLNGNLVSVAGSGYYEWIPGSPSFASVWSDGAHILDQTHPITQGLTDADLSGWWTSPDGYFSSFPGEALISQPNGIALFAHTLGLGKIVGASLDPDYHTWFNARGEDGKNDAKTLLKNIIDWLCMQPANWLEDALCEIEDLWNYVWVLHDEGEIDHYKYNRMRSTMSLVYNLTANAMWSLDNERPSFDDLKEGMYNLYDAGREFEGLVNDIENWVKCGLMPSELAEGIVEELERIQMKFVNKAREEAESEKMLAVAAIEDAEARGRSLPWLWNQISYIDQYLADAKYWIGEGWLSKAVSCYKMAFYYSQRIVVNAWHWSWDIQPEDWIDQLEANL